eukprot:c18562_g1_i1 orf=533-802(+)
MDLPIGISIHGMDGSMPSWNIISSDLIDATFSLVDLCALDSGNILVFHLLGLRCQVSTIAMSKGHELELLINMHMDEPVGILPGGKLGR